MGRISWTRVLLVRSELESSSTLQCARFVLQVCKRSFKISIKCYGPI